MNLRPVSGKYRSAGAVPAKTAVGNVVWMRDGAVWALWRVEPESYAYLTHAAKLQLHEDTRRAILAMPSEMMLFSVCTPVDPVRAAMSLLGRQGSRAQWVAESEESLGWIKHWDPFHRRHYLAGQLGTGEGWRGTLREFGSSLPRRALSRPTEHDIARRGKQAAKIQDALRNALAVEPVSAEEARWVYARLPLRGFRDLALPGGPRGEITAPGFAAVGGFVTTEGGSKKDYGRGILPPYLRVAAPSAEANRAGYQCHIVLADWPLGDYPGDTELLFALDRTVDFPVDWVIRGSRTTRAESLRKMEKKARQIQEDIGHDRLRQIEETGQIPVELEDAWEVLVEYRESVKVMRSEGSVEAPIALTVWGATRNVAESRAEALISELGLGEWGLYRPLGGQSALLELEMPGGRRHQVHREFRQTALASHIAGLGPFAGIGIGDDRGFLIGSQADGVPNRPVLLDLMAPFDLERSGSMMIVGTSGQGKSVLEKWIALALMAMGGRAAVIDPSGQGEWVRAARAISERTGCSLSVISTVPGEWVSFDPLRLFDDVKDAKAAAIGAAQLLTQASAGDNVGISITEAVEAVAARDDPCMQAVIDELRAMAEATLPSGEPRHPGSTEAARRLWAFSVGAFGPLAFDRSLPPADLSADLIVFHLPGLPLPDRTTMENEHLAKAMLSEQIGALGIFYLVVAAGKAYIGRDPTRPSGVILDEAWLMSKSSQGRAMMDMRARGGRKELGFLVGASQHPDDFDDPALLSLFTRQMMAAQGEGAGEKALRQLGIEPTPALVDKIEKDMLRRDREDASPQPARFLMRDLRGRVGEVLIRPPMGPLAVAFETNTRRLAAYLADTNGHVPVDEVETAELPV